MFIFFYIVIYLKLLLGTYVIFNAMWGSRCQMTPNPQNEASIVVWFEPTDDQEGHATTSELLISPLSVNAGGYGWSTWSWFLCCLHAVLWLMSTIVFLWMNWHPWMSVFFYDECTRRTEWFSKVNSERWGNCLRTIKVPCANTSEQVGTVLWSAYTLSRNDSTGEFLRCYYTDYLFLLVREDMAREFLTVTFTLEPTLVLCKYTTSEKMMSRSLAKRARGLGPKVVPGPG